MLAAPPFGGELISDMYHQDVFLTIAEIAATFAGFGGLITVFSLQRGSVRNAIGPRDLIENSLVAMFMALLPLLCLPLMDTAANGWRLCAGLYVVVFVLGAGAGIVRNTRQGIRIPPGIRLVMLVSIVGSVAVLTVIMLDGAQAELLYLIALGGPLLNAACFLLTGVLGYEVAARETG